MEEMRGKQALIDKLTHEMAILKRLKFAASSEAYSGEQQRMLFETLDTDIEALTAEIEQLAPTKPAEDDGKKSQPKRAPLPAALPRKEIRHDPASTTCGCGCQLQRIGEDVAEKLDYQPGVFTVERHIRGKWVCRQCETLVQAPVPPQIIDKGIPTAALLAHVLVAKYQDHLPLIPAKRHLRSRRIGHPGLNTGTVGRRVRCAAAAAGRCTASGTAGATRLAC